MMSDCTQCKKSGGSFWRATYVGAPEGGVPIYIKCAKEFYAALDASPFGPAWTEEEIDAYGPVHPIPTPQR